MLNSKRLFLLGLGLTAACVVPPDEPTDEIDESIIGGSAASQFQLDRAVKIPGCTATRISPRWALTALHCNPQVGALVNFYTTGPGFSTLTARIELVKQRPGTNTAACASPWPWNCDDGTGLFADVALLRLSEISTVIDSTASTPATLAWAYPGANAVGTKVGAGLHNGASNDAGVLRQINDTTDDSDDSDGDFITTTDDVNPGDSGGPFYASNRILGALNSYGWDPINGQYNVYTSIPRHLDWILQTIGYDWSGAPSQPNTTYQGTLLQSFSGGERACQYACDHTQSCQAYNHRGSSCGLYTNVTGASTQAGWHGALHYGSATGQSNEVVGYRRNDGFDAVLHKGTDGTVHELVRTGTAPWAFAPIQPMAGKPIAGKLSAYRRSDGKNAIVYRSTDGGVIEIRLDSTGWTARQINVGMPTANGDPVAFVRADGVSAVVYRSGTRIVELRLLSNQAFASTDLTAAASITSMPASSDPSPTVRADGITSVVYRSNGAIVELFRRPGEPWSAGVPSGLATHIDGGFPTAVPPAVSRPYASTRRDGRLAILYRSNTNNLIELTLESSGWKWDALAVGSPLDPNANPVQYVRTDVAESAMYRSSAGAVFEVARTAGYVHVPAQTPPQYNLSAAYGVVGAVTTDPQVYLRYDATNAIVYGLPSNRVGELSFDRSLGWGSNNLTFSAGEVP